MKRYFEVVAKCGHVGRDSYFEGHFFQAASNASDAARIVKTMPRVKRDHSDVILWVNEVEYKEYADGLKAMANNPYFHCRSRREQNKVMKQIADSIMPETERQRIYRERHGHAEYREKTKPDRNGLRNPYKYAKYNNMYYDRDWELI